jgi:hypothetical protein
MTLLVLAAYLELVRFDILLARGNFQQLYDRVRHSQVGGQSTSRHSIERICAAVDFACIWYWKEALCLQRSGATACLLKRHGVPAQMVIGAQLLPFKAHAWVEVNGQVVNDKPYLAEIYAVLDRC